MSALDVIVIGGGPAGLSAALLTHGNGLATLLLEQSDRLGGQLWAADAPIRDLLGQPAPNGGALATSLAEDAKSRGLPLRLSEPVRRLRRGRDGAFALEVSGGEVLIADAVVLATGTAPRRLGIPGEDDFDLYARARAAGGVYAGKPVVVIGGGDESVETARWLAEQKAIVSLVVRKQLRARPLIRKELDAHPEITLLEGEQVVRLVGAAWKLEAVELASGRRLPAEHAFARIGVETTTPRLEPEPDRHPDGRLKVDEYGRTSVPGLYAAGDVIMTGDRRYVSIAIGLGTLVGRAVETDRAKASEPNG